MFVCWITVTKFYRCEGLSPKNSRIISHFSALDKREPANTEAMLDRFVGELLLAVAAGDKRFGGNKGLIASQSVPSC